MNNQEIKNFCLSLIKADSEEEVIRILKNKGYWDNKNVWRYYGDYENNYNTIGNQMSSPDAALVEKLINSVDARLMNECLIKRIDPTSEKAPTSIQQAVALFFENCTVQSTLMGRVSNWSNNKRKEVAEGITLCATGNLPSQGYPCFTISDCGEGQTPKMIPDTFLSLTRANKVKILFVQGKFNMGGSGVLRFCGKNRFQLILTKRNPMILNGKFNDPTDGNWGFTIVRREAPEKGYKNSIFTYLAPVNCEHNKGDVLSFSSEKMPIFPDNENPYSQDSEWGTLVKLYEYKLTGDKSHILRKTGLMRRLDLLMPGVALPIRLFECRQYRGHKGSSSTTLTGIRVRLNDNKAENLEPDFPTSSKITVHGEEMNITIYAFNKGKAETYIKDEGVIFTLNGQSHGYLTTDFFRRKKVGLSYIANSLLLLIDCSKLSAQAREDLFMNNRDKLSRSEFRNSIERELEYLLKNDEKLRLLKNKRREENIEDQLSDSKPLEYVLNSILSKYPTLSSLFLEGKRIPNPFKTRKVKGEDSPFNGKKHPTFFKFKNKKYGEDLYKECPVGHKARIIFETNVVNDYFIREEDQGEFKLFIKFKSNNKDEISDINYGFSEEQGEFKLLDESKNSTVEEIADINYGFRLENGIATLNLTLPEECKVDDSIICESTVNDQTLLEPFVNKFVIKIIAECSVSSGRSEKSKKPSQDKGSDRDSTYGIQLPNIIKISEEHWKWDESKFDKYLALMIKHIGSSENGKNSDKNIEQPIYDFYVNIDNHYLKTEMKNQNKDPKIIEAQFIYGLVLFGLSLINDEIRNRNSENDDENNSEDEDFNETGKNIEKKVESFSRAIAPIMLPMIDSLGALDEESEFAMNNGIGEAT